MRPAIPLANKMAYKQPHKPFPGEIIQAELPPYDKPPPWIPPEERPYDRRYNNDIDKFLPRTITLSRTKATDQLGFNVRGGKEYHCGIYVSKVLPDTKAERLGLREGDQIIQVNEVDFESIEHAEAVRVLKRNTEILLLVKYFPFGYEKTYDKTKFLQQLQQQQGHQQRR